MLDFAEQHPTNLRNPKGREGKPKLLPSETQHFSSDESDDGSYDNGTVLIVNQQKTKNSKSFHYCCWQKN